MPLTARAALRIRLPRGRGASNISLRERLHVNTLISPPGTAEVDWAGLYSLTTTNFAMPSTIKYTPQGPFIVWGRTEYSVSFDALDSIAIRDRHVTQFSQAMTLTATSVLFDGERLDIAVAPQATVLLRGDSGMRLGAVAIARYDVGQNSIGGTFAWSGATHASDTNPAGTFDIGAGFGRRLAPRGLLGKFTPHVNVVWERSTGVDPIMSMYEGVEFQMTDRFALDVTGQHLGVNGTVEHQVVFGITLGIGGKH
jgi:hypothetical protein